MNSTYIYIYICQDNVYFKTPFLLINNMIDKVILGNPFMFLMYPFTTDTEGIITSPFGQLVKFKCLRNPELRDINVLKDISTSNSINLIHNKCQENSY